MISALMRECWGTVVMLVWFAVGCEQQPSKLDVRPGATPEQFAESQAWLAIEERALPMSIRNDLLQAAVAFPDRGPIEQRAASLVAWMEAGGSVPIATTLTALTAPGFDLYVMRILELVRAKPDDELLFEAALYAAWKLRSDGIGFSAAFLANVLTIRLAGLRPTPPAVAARYAPTDEQVFRVFAG